MVKRLCVLGILLWVLVGCNPTTPTPASTPTPMPYVTFKEAFTRAQVAVVQWDAEGVLTSAQAFPEPDQSGQARAWLFGMAAPTQGNDLVIGASGKGSIGVAEKGGEVCVNGEWQRLWNVAYELGCEFGVEGGLTARVAEATRCLQEAANNGEIEITPCDDPQDLKTWAIHIGEIQVDSPEAVSLARQHGWADAELVGMRIREGMWTLTFSVMENDVMTYQYVEVDAQTGEVKP